jgi:hypothetical protein
LEQSISARNCAVNAKVFIVASPEQINIDGVVDNFQRVLPQGQSRVRQARPVLARVSPIVPEADKFSVFRSVKSDRTAKVAAYVAEGFDLSVVLVQQNIVVIHPARLPTRLL